MPEHVHISERPDWADEFLSKTNVETTFGGDVDPNTTILVQGRISEENLRNLPKLRVAIVPWAGVPPETREAIRKAGGISLYNLHHNAADTAEMAIALTFAVARRLPLLDSGLKKNDWTPEFRHKLRWQVDNDGDEPTQFSTHMATRLSGKRALVLGYGAIGQHIGRVLGATGMVIDPVTTKNIGELDRLLETANLLVVALPLTPATEGIINERRLALLPEGAIVVNIGRGAIIEEESLFRALQSGHLGGAGLDVWWQYPAKDSERTNSAPSKFNFASLPNVVMTPHVGGGTDASEPDRCVHLLDLIGKIVKGEPVRPVSLEEGY
jgi:phosphoglycerate dehydrogenase-like enzyme